MSGYYGPVAAAPDALVAAVARAARYAEAATLVTVVCQHDHVLVRVLDTDHGAVAVWDAPGLAWTDDSTDARMRTRRASRQSVWALVMDGEVGGYLQPECRCHHAYLPVAELRAAVAHGRRRVLARPSAIRGIDTLTA